MEVAVVEETREEVRGKSGKSEVVTPIVMQHPEDAGNEMV